MPAVQAKLEVGAPNDSFEQEAERVADQVMRIPADAAVAPASAPAGRTNVPWLGCLRNDAGTTLTPWPASPV